jgi:hypothetical protein
VDKFPISTEAFLFVVEEYIDEAEFFHICLVHLNISYKRATSSPLLLPLPLKTTTLTFEILYKL